MIRPQVHVLFEHGRDQRPYGSAHIRLLRPLSHPSLRAHLVMTAGWELPHDGADVVIVDRLWRPDISLRVAEEVVGSIRSSGARLLYSLDDDFLSLPTRMFGGISAEHQEIVRYLLIEADGVVVTTHALQQRFATYQDRCMVIPNSLDERLLAGRLPATIASPFGRRPLTIGYMGTFTHGHDLQMILPAWQALHRKYGAAVQFQIIGVTRSLDDLHALGLPVRVLEPRPGESEYPLFMPWFTSEPAWDIAVAPLAATEFNSCKSDIKFLDYCALGAAGIYSDVPAYAGTVRHRETGWLTSNTEEGWIAALDTLISDEQLRMHIAHNGRRYLYAQRLVTHNVSGWIMAVQNALGAVQETRSSVVTQLAS